MAGEKNAPAQRKPTGQEMDRQYDELHQGNGPQGQGPAAPSDALKAHTGRKPTGQEMDQQYDELHQGPDADAPPPA